MTRHMFPFLIGAMTFKFPDHDDILTALHQLEVNLPCMEIFYPPDAFECNLMAVEGTASFLVVKRPLDRDFLFTIGTIAGFGASLRFLTIFQSAPAVVVF